MERTTCESFSLNKSRYDLTSFYGRWRYFMDVIDPRTLFVSKIKLKESVDLLEQFKNGTLSPKITDEQLWEAQKIKQAIIHPDTKENIFLPFRMSGVVPFGSPIVVGLLLPNPSLYQTIFWQWLNQSHNACTNYANRNASQPTSTQRFLFGYCGAVCCAVTIAVGLSVAIKKTRNMSPTMKLLVQKFVPFPAVATASTCNVILMRFGELFDGIEVFDENEKIIGTSKIAAKKALTETAITRVILPAPIFIIPPAVMTLLEKTKFLKRNPKYHLLFNALITTCSFGFALPVALALFPQLSSIQTKQLEPNIQQLTDSSELFYNKGL